MKPRVVTIAVDDGDPDKLTLVQVIAKPHQLADTLRDVRRACALNGCTIVGELHGEAELERFLACGQVAS